METPEYIAYIDQASFAGLRALGHGPQIQFIWIYDRDVDLDALRRFQHNLGRGVLGRRIERSPLPFGRHRWVTWTGPEDVEVATTVLPRTELVAWADQQGARPIDPEFGPPWRLTVQPLADGGTAVTLVVSHTTGDGVGINLAVAAAANGITRDLGYPPPDSRSKSQALRQDSRAVLREVPEMARAVSAAVQLAKASGRQASGQPRPPKVSRELEAHEVTLPSLTVRLDPAQWDERAKQLGGTSNSLFLGFAARLAQKLGWLDPGGTATLSVPVNERVEGDTRGNALTAVRLTADPNAVTGDLREIRADLKSVLSTLGDARHELLAPLPLVPFVPKRLARRLETMVVGGRLIGSSNLGDLDPAVNRPDGAEADHFAIRMAEHITLAHLRRAGGVFFPVVAGRVGGEMFISVAYCNADGTTTRDYLVDVVRATLDDFALTATIE